MMSQWFSMAVMCFLMGVQAAMAGPAPAGVLQKNGIGTVYIVPLEPIPIGQMYYTGPGNFTAMGFAVAALVGTPGAAEGIKATAVKNDIHIDRIVTEELRHALEDSHKVEVSAGESQDAYNFSLAIYQWGFSAPNGFSKKLVPVLTMECQLKNSEGRSVWKERFHVLPLGNPVDGMIPDDLVKDPKNIEGGWRRVARYIADKCVKAL